LRSTLAHIYDDVKAKTFGISPSIGSAKKSPLVSHLARNAKIRFNPQIAQCKHSIQPAD
jgi:hypothetical protein